MSATKSALSVLAVVLGVTGVLACAAGVAGVWWARNQLDITIASTFERVDQLLGRVEELTGQRNGLVEGLQSAIEKLNSRVQSRIAESHGVSEEKADEVDEKERGIYDRIQRTRNVIELTRARIDLVQQLLAMARSTSAFMQADSHSALDLAKTARVGLEEIEQMQLLPKNSERPWSRFVPTGTSKRTPRTSKPFRHGLTPVLRRSKATERGWRRESCSFAVK